MEMRTRGGKMTEKELNRWCHKFMGYCLSGNEDCGCTPRDYTESLDLASIVEAKAIETVGWQPYMDALWDLAVREMQDDMSKKLPQIITTASALARCQASRAALEGK